MQRPLEPLELRDLPLLEGGVAGDSVSVTVAIGMCVARASAFRRWISGVAFCEL